MNSSKKYSHPQKIGQGGENVAADYLEKRGYKMIEQNFLCRGGEIDLIAEKNGEFHFIEVKTRYDHSYGEPLESIDDAKIQKLSRAAQYYVLNHQELEKSSKVFSVISVDYTHAPPRIEFFENAFEFQGSGAY